MYMYKVHVREQNRFENMTMLTEQLISYSAIGACTVHVVACTCTCTCSCLYMYMYM